MTEWKIDSQGRKYREIGPGCKEYMPMITIDGFEIENTPEAIAAFHSARKANEVKPEPQPEEKALCPFNFKGNFPVKCKTSCAFHRATGCAQKRQEAAQDTKDMFCPYMRKCTDLCALYAHGCTL